MRTQDLVYGDPIQIRPEPSLFDEGLGERCQIPQWPQPPAQSTGDDNSAAGQKGQGEIARRRAEDG